MNWIPLFCIISVTLILSAAIKIKIIYCLNRILLGAVLVFSSFELPKTQPVGDVIIISFLFAVIYLVAVWLEYYLFSQTQTTRRLR